MQIMIRSSGDKLEHAMTAQLMDFYTQIYIKNHPFCNLRIKCYALYAILIDGTYIISIAKSKRVASIYFNDINYIVPRQIRLLKYLIAFQSYFTRMEEMFRVMYHHIFTN